MESEKKNLDAVFEKTESKTPEQIIDPAEIAELKKAVRALAESEGEQEYLKELDKDKKPIKKKQDGFWENLKAEVNEFKGHVGNIFSPSYWSKVTKEAAQKSKDEITEAWDLTGGSMLDEMQGKGERQWEGEKEKALGRVGWEKKWGGEGEKKYILQK